MKLKRVSLTSILWSVFSLTSQISVEKYAFGWYGIILRRGSERSFEILLARVLDRRRLRVGYNLGHCLFLIFSYDLVAMIKLVLKFCNKQPTSSEKEIRYSAE